VKNNIICHWRHCVPLPSASWNNWTVNWLKLVLQIGDQSLYRSPSKRWKTRHGANSPWATIPRQIPLMGLGMIKTLQSLGGGKKKGFFPLFSQKPKKKIASPNLKRSSSNWGFNPTPDPA